jgi:hypothetical protein
MPIFRPKNGKSEKIQKNKKILKNTFFFDFFVDFTNMSDII